jgi:peptidoglycan lytic transglycosylase B
MFMRIPAVLLGLALLLPHQVPAVLSLPQLPFDEWLRGVRDEAKTRGIKEATLDKAFTGLEPLPVVIERDRSQAEIVQPLDRYLETRVSAKVVRTAREKRREQSATLARVSAKYGVPPGIVVAVWGLESNFGRFSGIRPTIQTLATLAYDPRRSAMFREELFDALSILDSGDVEPSAMRGSWAGALGQPQFMPSSFLLYAQDFDGDGRRDIWSSTPDVFASIGNYLAAKGWTRDQAWGREVQVPDTTLQAVAQTAPFQTEGCLARRQMTVPMPVTEWKKIGVRTRTGGPLPDAGIDASLISGGKRHFLVYPNYAALLEYNCVNAYALSVGLLADASATASTASKSSTVSKGSKTSKGSTSSKGSKKKL